FNPPKKYTLLSSASKLLFLLDMPPEVLFLCMHGRHLLLFTEKWISLKRHGAACSLKKRPDALLWHPARGMACKGLCTLAGR
ncbi:unnamed protein product, partial [Brassica rapa subsp. narinosa]